MKITLLKHCYMLLKYVYLDNIKNYQLKYKGFPINYLTYKLYSKKFKIV